MVVQVHVNNSTLLHPVLIYFCGIMWYKATSLFARRDIGEGERSRGGNRAWERYTGLGPVGITIIVSCSHCVHLTLPCVVHYNQSAIGASCVVCLEISFICFCSFLPSQFLYFRTTLQVTTKTYTIRMVNALLLQLIDSKNGQKLN